MRPQRCGSGRPRFIGALTHSCRTFYLRGPTKAAERPVLAPTAPPAPTKDAKLPLHTSTTTTTCSPTSTRNSHNFATFATTPRLTTTRLAAVSRYTTSRQFTTTATTMSQGEWTGVKVRQTFFEFFEERGHTKGMQSVQDPNTGYGNIRAPVACQFPRPRLHFHLLRPRRRSSDLCTDLVLLLQSHLPPSSLTMTPPCSSPMLA